MQQNYLPILSLLAAIGFAVTGCGPKKISDRSGTARGLIQMPDGTEVATTATRGGVTASLDPNSTTAQLVNINDGALSGLSVAFPVGCLSIRVSISITPGASVSGASMMSGLGMNNNVSSSGTPVEISASSAIDLRSPMVLALPVPRRAGLVESAIDRAHLAVIYRINVAEGSSTGSYMGIVPAKDLGWDNDKVLFETKFFGWYSVVEMAEPVTSAVEKKAEFTDRLTAKWFATLAELPACTSGDLYRIAYVEAEKIMYYCGPSAAWVAIPAPEVPVAEETTEPLRVVKNDGTVVGIVLALGSAGQVVVTGSDGALYMVPVNFTTTTLANGISISNVNSTTTMFYYTVASCGGDTYASWSPMSVPTPTENISGVLYKFESSAPFTYASFRSGSCNDASGTLTSPYKMVPVTANLLPIPFTEAWHLE